MWNIIEFEELASTNTLANEMLAHGEAQHRDVIQAYHQNRGRGRAAGRVWNDEAGASLLMSAVLTTIPEPASLLQYRAALAVIAALRNIGERDGTSEKNFRLKWPNDILLDGKKVCGILLEAQWNASQMRSAIIGIGINVKQSEFPEPLGAVAHSLRMCGIDMEVQDVRNAVLEQLRLELEREDRLDNSILTRLRAELAWMSELPSLQWFGSDGTNLSEIRYEDIDNSGALRLRLPDGSIVIRHSGSLALNA
jgi:BirA family transcriptional regulator, biotin operon repressor / biotin---[acetyl-CoA-carboxylase] ligase